MDDVAAVPRGWRKLGPSLIELVSPATIAEESRRRSVHRYRRITFTAITSLGAKAIGLVTAVVIVPLTFRYLGPERYGLWMTMTSLVLFLGSADLGLGNGLTSRIAEADGKNAHERAATFVTCAFYSLLLVSVVMAIVFGLAMRFIDWSAWYGVTSALAAHEAVTATCILVFCMLASLPLGTVLRVQAGFQRGFISDCWTAAGSLLALCGVLLVIRSGHGLPALVFTVAGIPLVVTLCNWIVQFVFIRPDLRPRLHLFKASVARSLLAVGGIFFAQQCFGLIYYLSDNLVIARTMGAVEVAHYAVVQRIFSIGLITQFLMVPLWPALGEALARRDFDWAARAGKRAIFLACILSGLCALTLLAASRSLVTRWSGVDPGPIDLLRVGFAVWVVLVGYIATMNAILNQKGVMKRHILLFGAAALGSLVLKILFARHGSVAGVIWSTDIAFGILYVGPTLLLARSTFHPRAAEVHA